MKSKSPRPSVSRDTAKPSTRKSTVAADDAHDILVPIDFSKASREILRHAILLAKALPGKITLLHAEEPPNYGGTLSDLPGSVPADFPLAPAKLGQRLATLARDAIPPALFREAIVAQGAAGETIVSTATRRRSVLIVVATHGYSGLTRILLGSTAEYVVRHSPCPVLTIRRPGARAATTAPRYKSILAPVDLSAPSRLAADTAASLAGRLGARLTLLHVVPPLAASRRRPLDATQLNARAAEGADERLQEIALRLQKVAPRVTTRVALGDAAAEILQAATAKKSPPDLIVLATHGRGGLSRILLGSTAENIIRHSPCPVLVVRQPKPAKRHWYNPLFFFPVAPMLP